MTLGSIDAHTAIVDRRRCCAAINILYCVPRALLKDVDGGWWVAVGNQGRVSRPPFALQAPLTVTPEERR